VTRTSYVCIVDSESVPEVNCTRHHSTSILFILSHRLSNFQRWNFVRNLFSSVGLLPTNHNILYLTTLSIIEVLYQSWWNFMFECKVFLVHAMKSYRCSGGIAPMILKFDISWRWVVIVMPLPLSSRLTSTILISWSTGRLAGPRVGLSFLFCRRLKPTDPVGIRNSDFASCSQVIYRLIYSGS
jgi:hypothetical protein